MSEQTTKRVRLGEVATYVNGYAFKPSDWSVAGKPIIRIQDLTGNSYKMNRFSGSIPAKYNVVDGDILISWSASLGVYIWNREDAFLNQHIFKVVFDKIPIDKSFFYYQVGRILEGAASSAHGCTMRHLTKPVFDALPFVLPPLAEQKRIAEVLDKISAMKRNAEARVQKLDLLVKSRFVEMFGDGKKWAQRTIGELCDLITDGEHVTPKRVASGIYLLSARNIHNHQIQVDDVDYIDETEYRRIAKRIIPQVGDILLSCSGSVGRCCAVPVGLKCQLVRSVALLRFSQSIMPKFAEYLLCSQGVQSQINTLKTASSQANLFQGKIRRLMAYEPPLALQREFAAFVEKVEALKATAQRECEQVDLLYRAKLQEYFG